MVSACRVRGPRDNRKLLQSPVREDLSPPVEDRLYAILAETNMVTTADEIDTFLCGRPTDAHADGHPLLSLAHHKREFSTCWLAFLRRLRTPALYKRVLLNLHSDVIPHLANPALLIDFLTDSYNVGA